MDKKDPLNCTVLHGSYRRDRTGIRAVHYVERLLCERGNPTTVIDAREYNLPILDRMYKEHPKGSAPENLEKLAAIYRKTDLFVMVTGEYNHSIQPGLKNLLDHFLEEYFFRPSAIVSYSAGVFGGARAAVHLREILGELGTPSIPSVFSIGKITEALNEDGTRADGKSPKSAERFLEEAEWYARALKEARAKHGVPY